MTALAFDVVYLLAAAAPPPKPFAIGPYVDAFVDWAFFWAFYWFLVYVLLLLLYNFLRALRRAKPYLWPIRWVQRFAALVGRLAAWLWLFLAPPHLRRFLWNFGLWLRYWATAFILYLQESAFEIAEFCRRYDLATSMRSEAILPAFWRSLVGLPSFGAEVFHFHGTIILSWIGERLSRPVTRPWTVFGFFKHLVGWATGMTVVFYLFLALGYSLYFFCDCAFRFIDYVCQYFLKPVFFADVLQWMLFLDLYEKVVGPARTVILGLFFYALPSLVGAIKDRLTSREFWTDYVLYQLILGSFLRALARFLYGCYYFVTVTAYYQTRLLLFNGRKVLRYLRWYLRWRLPKVCARRWRAFRRRLWHWMRILWRMLSPRAWWYFLRFYLPYGRWWRRWHYALWDLALWFRFVWRLLVWKPTWGYFRYRSRRRFLLWQYWRRLGWYYALFLLLPLLFSTVMLLWLSLSVLFFYTLWQLLGPVMLWLL